MKGMKKHLSMPSLLKRMASYFKTIKEPAGKRAKLPLADCLMSGLALFGLKMPSLLAFDKQTKEERLSHNLRHLYGIGEIPSDTYFRERLDEVEPQLLRKPFNQVLACVQRQGLLKRFEYYEQHYLISLDGTGCFSSHEVHCDSCCVKEHRDGTKTYYHQMLAAVLVHPDEKTVLPLAPESILKQDGAKKNDCERVAAKRLLEQLRREHPHLKIIVTEDGLGSNGPHLRLLKELKMSYIIGAKPDDHKYLFEFIRAVKTEKLEEKDKDGTVRRYSWFNGAPLNDTHEDFAVNFLEYEEISKKGKVQRFTWVTDIPLNANNVYQIMRGGRARWKVENETFNTLKNQGYHFEHNFGHGYKHLSTVMAMLMFLAFLIDQAQETCCESFQKALRKMGRKSYLWERLRSLFHHFFILSWTDIYEAIAGSHYGGVLEIPNTS
jgi:hypothetical protein